MNFLLQTILANLLVYKYSVLFVVTFLAALALPIPSAATLMASAAFASQGYFSLAWVLIIATLGNIAGDNLGFFLARVYGRPVLYKLGFRKILESETITTIEQAIKKKPAFIIFFSRFEVIATLSVNFISGLGKVTYKKFLFYEVLGEFAQVCVFASVGYAFGSSWEAVNGVIGKFSLVITLVVILLLFVLRKKIVMWAVKETK